MAYAPNQVIAGVDGADTIDGNQVSHPQYLLEPGNVGLAFAACKPVGVFEDSLGTQRQFIGTVGGRGQKD